MKHENLLDAMLVLTVAVIVIAGISSTVSGCSIFQRPDPEVAGDLASKCATDCADAAVKSTPIQTVDRERFVEALTDYLTCVGMCTGTGIVAEVLPVVDGLAIDPVRRISGRSEDVD